MNMFTTSSGRRNSLYRNKYTINYRDPSTAQTDVSIDKAMGTIYVGT